MSFLLAWTLPLVIPTHHLSDPPPRDDLLPLQEPIGEALVELRVQRVDPVLGRLQL